MASATTSQAASVARATTATSAHKVWSRVNTPLLKGVGVRDDVKWKKHSRRGEGSTLMNAARRRACVPSSSEGYLTSVQYDFSASVVNYSTDRRLQKFDKRNMNVNPRMAMAASNVNVSVVEEKDSEVLQGVSEACQAWANAVQRLSVSDVVDLYDTKDGTLLGTVDTGKDGVRSSPETIREYFNGFLSKDSVTPEFPAFNAEDVIVISPTVAVYNGYYAFKLEKGGVTNIANAKFTFMYRKDAAGKWKIVLHNSGFTPEGLVVEKKKRRWFWPF